MHNLGILTEWRGQFDLEICAPQCMLLQCGSGRLSHATVALLGRFLPRLGPLPQGERPFFFDHSAAARYGRSSSTGISSSRSANNSNSRASLEKEAERSYRRSSI